MFKAFRIRPVVESMDENGEVTCEAFATLAAVERDSAQFEARRSVSGREGKTMIWTLYGVNPEEAASEPSTPSPTAIPKSSPASC